ncbi:MAG: thioredoxin domain-containing protein [Candidatus Nanoarchaeia archaeon]|nr:thioredoxin domain-containing protein [Candidatus Nanoarchaeia archaeon]
MKKTIISMGLAAIAATATLTCARQMPAEAPVYEGPAVTELTPENFDEALQTTQGPVVVDFYANWCGPCNQMKPIYEKVCEDLRGEVRCFAFNVDQDRGQENRISSRYEARYIPSYRYFHNNVEDAERRVSGARSEGNLKNEIEDFIRSCQ